MSAWAYKNCTCGERIHINFICDKCGGDPWKIRDEAFLQALEDIDELKTDLTHMIKRLERIENTIKYKLKPFKVQPGNPTKEKA